MVAATIPRYASSESLTFFVSPEGDCTTAETTLEQGDTLVVFSDGASEAVNAANEEFGEERLAAIIDRPPQGSAADLLDTIVTAVMAHGGSQQFDDLTLLVARGR